MTTHKRSPPSAISQNSPKGNCMRSFTENLTNQSKSGEWQSSRRETKIQRVNISLRTSRPASEPALIHSSWKRANNDQHRYSTWCALRECERLRFNGRIDFRTNKYRRRMEECWTFNSNNNNNSCLRLTFLRENSLMSIKTFVILTRHIVCRVDKATSQRAVVHRAIGGKSVSIQFS